MKVKEKKEISNKDQDDENNDIIPDKKS